jgi:hypothetical protein
LLGTIGVIGSLIFVGLELQQSQRIALAGQQQARTELNSSRLSNPCCGKTPAHRQHH